MRRVARLVFSLVFIAATARVTVAQQPASLGGCPDSYRVAYSAPHDELTGSIAVEVLPPLTAPSPRGEPSNRSPQGTAVYLVKEPDTMKPGPWTIEYEVFGNETRPLHLRIHVLDDAYGRARAKWLNEKLLWIQMWRGRIISTDAILDVETGKYIYKEDATYISTPCREKRAP